MRFTAVLLTLFIGHMAVAQDAETLLGPLRARMATLNDMSCNVQMVFNIPGVQMKQLGGKLYFKRPDRFKVAAKGLVFVPKQNPFGMFDLLARKGTYMAMVAGAEAVNGNPCHIINIMPTDQKDLVMVRLFIGKADGRIHRSDITLRREGTVVYRNTYANATDLLPNVIDFEADFKKFRMPKAITGDFNSKPVAATEGQKYETGRIRMTLSGMQMNKKLDDSVFIETDGL